MSETTFTTEVTTWRRDTLDPDSLYIGPTWRERLYGSNDVRVFIGSKLVKIIDPGRAARSVLREVR